VTVICYDVRNSLSLISFPKGPVDMLLFMVIFIFQTISLLVFVVKIKPLLHFHVAKIEWDDACVPKNQGSMALENFGMIMFSMFSHA